MRMIVAFAFTAAMAAGPARAASCSPSRIADTATALQDARFALLQVPAHDGTGTQISTDTAQAIAAVKAHLADFVTAYMNCQHNTADPGGIEMDLSRLGWARDGDAAPSDADPFKADPSLRFEVRPFAGGLLGISAAFGVPCGNDTILMLFEQREDGFSEIMRVQSPAYHDLAKAYDAFDYAISPLDDAGHWFLAEKHLPTTCISANAVISYSVLRVSSFPTKPRVVFTGHDPIFWGNEDFGHVGAAADSFWVSFHDYADTGELTETSRSYSVVGNIVQPAR